MEVVSVMEKQRECEDPITEVEHGAVDWHLGPLEENISKKVTKIFSPTGVSGSALVGSSG